MLLFCSSRFICMLSSEAIHPVVLTGPFSRSKRQINHHNTIFTLLATCAVDTNGISASTERMDVHNLVLSDRTLHRDGWCVRVLL